MGVRLSLKLTFKSHSRSNFNALMFLPKYQVRLSTKLQVNFRSVHPFTPFCQWILSKLSPEG
jgi:hypothetical protein